MRSSSETSIGLSLPCELAELLEDDDELPFFFPVFFFLFNVATLEGFLQRREDLAPAVGDQHVVLDADAALAREVDPRLDRHDHPGPQLFFGAGLAEGRKLVDVAADAVTEA